MWLLCRNVNDYASLPEGYVRERDLKIVKKLQEESATVGPVIH